MSSLPDGAEYWWDVKSNNRHRYHPTHATVNRCHLSNGDESNVVDDIDCHYCKGLMTPESLAEMENKEIEKQRRFQQSASAKRENRKHLALMKLKGNPICVCGFPMTLRTNRTKGTQFYGCIDYPNCKLTKSR